MDFDLWFGISVFEMDYIEFIGDRDSLWDDPGLFQTGLLLLDKIHCFYRHSYDLGFRLQSQRTAVIAHRKQWKIMSEIMRFYSGYLQTRLPTRERD